tara:strand:- start:3829 stop:4335 length:507 start_codon:yes stop_codon:yes gene_type:complete
MKRKINNKENQLKNKDTDISPITIIRYNYDIIILIIIIMIVIIIIIIQIYNRSLKKIKESNNKLIYINNKVIEKKNEEASIGKLRVKNIDKYQIKTKIQNYYKKQAILNKDINSEIIELINIELSVKNNLIICDVIYRLNNQKKGNRTFIFNKKYDIIQMSKNKIIID